MLNTDINRNNITRRKFLQITAASMFLALLSRESVISAFMGLNDVSSSSGNVATAWTSWLWSQTNRSQMDAGLLSNVETATSPGNVKLAMLASDFYTSGTISSQIFDSEEIGTRWDALIWDEVLVPNTGITFQVRASDTPFAKDASSPSWSTAYGSSPVQAGMPSGRYMQWRATLTTSDVASTPTLNEVRVYFSGPLTSGAIQVTDIGAPSGTVEVGNKLTAGALTPVGAAATAAYQWQRTTEGTFGGITGATSNEYTLVEGDHSEYVRVMANGTGDYKGSVASAYVGPVLWRITDIGAITGTAKVGQPLTASALTPYGATATATYQWQRQEWDEQTAEMVWGDISGATSKSYTLTAIDYDDTHGIYIRVKATGSLSSYYTGTVTSAAKGPVQPGTFTMAGISGTVVVGETLTAGALTPSSATVNYQWYSTPSLTEPVTWTAISGAESNSYTIQGSDNNNYLRVVATGTGAYEGCTDTKTTTSKVRTTSTPITYVAISGTANVGETLETVVTPQGATVNYQWKRSTTSDGTYSNIGTDSSTYTLTTADYDCYIKVVATANGGYSGEVESTPVGDVDKGTITINPIAGTTEEGETLIAGTVYDKALNVATADYQWQICDTENGTYDNIIGATNNTYLIVHEDLDKFIRVAATGTGAYTGTVYSEPTGPVVEESFPLEDIYDISNAKVGQLLEAGDLDPEGATANYQWWISEDGITYEKIDGAESSTYTPVLGDLNYYIKVKATGSGAYYGTVESNAIQVAAGPINISAITGLPQPVKGNTPVRLLAGTIQYYDATISWSPERFPAGKYANNQIYTATFTLSPKTGYTVTGIPANYFTVEGATSVSNSANSGVVTVVFPAT